MFYVLAFWVSPTLVWHDSCVKTQNSQRPLIIISRFYLSASSALVSLPTERQTMVTRWMDRAWSHTHIRQYGFWVEVCIALSRELSIQKLCLLFRLSICLNSHHQSECLPYCTMQMDHQRGFTIRWTAFGFVHAMLLMNRKHFAFLYERFSTLNYYVSVNWKFPLCLVLCCRRWELENVAMSL